MENKIVKLAILDMYEGTKNLGMINIQDIVIGFEKDIEYDVFDVRGNLEIPDLSYDIYIFSGGPGSPLVGKDEWMKPFYGLIDDLWNHNRFGSGSKKYCFFICHSFQMACHHFGVGTITRRRVKSFGTFPVFKTDAGRGEWLFQKLEDPFWVADFREYEVTQPDFKKMEELGAKLLLIEQERVLPELERAMMAVRFSDEMIGTQFHPEADPVGMRGYFTDEKRLVAIITEFGKSKLESMIKDLNHPDKIERTFLIILPYFLHRAIVGVRESSLELV